jgi:hypothetical protein
LPTIGRYEHPLGNIEIITRNTVIEEFQVVETIKAFLFLMIVFTPNDVARAQPEGPGGRHMRAHTATVKKPVFFEPSNKRLDGSSQVHIKVSGGERIIKSNGIPDHLVGRFPNCGNPHTIAEQDHYFKTTTKPSINRWLKELEGGWAFGVAVNGVPFEPLAAEWYKGRPDSVWRYEALSGAIDLGADENQAHVQPGGKYHYHGLPHGLLTAMNVNEDRHSPIIGWAADGFPIYSLFGYSNKKNRSGGISEFKSSFRLKAGDRSGFFSPNGDHDGAFNYDYEFVEGLGYLDQCNGTNVTTPDFPEGTYAYFLTKDWPIIPRCFAGSPDFSFNSKGRGGPPGFGRGSKPVDCRKGPPGYGPPGEHRGPPSGHGHPRPPNR